MNRVSVGAAMALLVLIGDAGADGYSRSDDRGRYQGANQVLLAGSGDNPWAMPNHRREGRGLPEYITNPKYPTQEDIETKLDYGRDDQGSGNQPMQQQQRYPQQMYQGYGAPIGPPALPQIYAPYGYGYPAYPGMGVMPGLGAPYTGDTGFGGNPMVTPYGDIYGPGVPDQRSQPSLNND